MSDDEIWADDHRAICRRHKGEGCNCDIVERRWAAFKTFVIIVLAVAAVVTFCVLLPMVALTLVIGACGLGVVFLPFAALWGLAEHIVKSNTSGSPDWRLKARRNDEGNAVISPSEPGANSK